MVFAVQYAGNIMCMPPANERRRYIVTSSLIGWAQTQNDPCYANMTVSLWWYNVY